MDISEDNDEDYEDMDDDDDSESEEETEQSQAAQGVVTASKKVEKPTAAAKRPARKGKW